MRRGGNGPADHQWGRFGFLIADFFTLLAMLFLVANTVGHVPIPKPTPSTVSGGTVGPTPTPVICGLNPTPQPNVYVTINNDAALRNLDPGAERQAADAIKSQVSAKFGGSFTGTVGLAQVWGGSYNGNQDVGDGTNLAKGAIGSLKLLADSDYLFTHDKTIYQPLWLGNLQSNQIMLTLFLYNVTFTDSCANR